MTSRHSVAVSDVSELLFFGQKETELFTAAITAVLSDIRLIARFLVENLKYLPVSFLLPIFSGYLFLHLQRDK